MHVLFTSLYSVYNRLRFTLLLVYLISQCTLTLILIYFLIADVKLKKMRSRLLKVVSKITLWTLPDCSQQLPSTWHLSREKHHTYRYNYLSPPPPPPPSLLFSSLYFVYCSLPSKKTIVISNRLADVLRVRRTMVPNVDDGVTWTSPNVYSVCYRRLMPELIDWKIISALCY